MERQEKSRLEPPSDAGPLLEGEVAIVLASQGDTDPSTLLQHIREFLGHCQGQLLFLTRSRDAWGAGIAAPMPRIDEDDRASGKPSLANPDFGDRLRHFQRDVPNSCLANHGGRVANDVGSFPAGGHGKQRDGRQYRRTDRQPDCSSTIHGVEVTVADGRRQAHRWAIF